MGYREFYSQYEVDEWVSENYGEWVNILKKEKYNFKEVNTDLADLLYFYAGNKYKIYNEILRGFGGYTKEEKGYYLKEINIINKGIARYQLNEDIVVWRLTYKELLKSLFKDYKIKKNNTFTDKAFISTTLFLDSLDDFSKEHRCDCLLKLHLPKGTRGAYIKFNRSRLSENEFLLPPGTTFILKNKHYSFKYRKWVYESLMINQEIY